MNLHAIVLQQANDEIIRRIKASYPSTYSINDKCFLVRTDEISEKIATNAGIMGDDRVEDSAGAVFKLNGAHSGYATSSLWEWLAIQEES